MVSISITEQDIWAALEGVQDPEIPVINVVEMGIVRQVKLEGTHVTVTMTPTFSGCPALHVIRESLERAVFEIGIRDVEIRTVLAPAWTTDWITAQAKAKLLRYGISPPAPTNQANLMQLEVNPIRCPRCDSINTQVKNTFGPTLCKSIHVCSNCLEPFEAFKSV
jgi:ring-1,2-phenylacetyl-CoA epoxidase subunit PaaD